MQKAKVSSAQLQKFKPFDSFSDQELVLVGAKSSLKHLDAGVVVFDIGSQDQIEYFLLAGSIELESYDGRVKVIEAGVDSACTAIALLQPRKYKVKTLQNSTFVLVDQQAINTILKEHSQDDNDEYRVTDLHSGEEMSDIVSALADDLENNKLKLPSFPEVAMEIKGLLDDPKTTVTDISTVLNNDPAITVKLLKTCNSALYRTQKEITSSHEAIVRLGYDTTRQLVTIFVMKELFQSKNKFLQAQMRALWSRSREVASMAYVLAEITPGMNAEHAMLAGLIQNIGTIPILNYLERYPNVKDLEGKVDEITRKLSAQVGGDILRKWEFQGDLIEVVENAENWLYESGSKKATYADIVIVARVHTYIGKETNADLPAFDKIPSFKKLGKDGLTPKQSQLVLSKSLDKIAEIKALLNPESTTLAS